MLVTFTGHKSGKTYTTPVQYKQAGRALKFVTRRSRTWWKNLRMGVPVRVLLRGKTISDTPHVTEGDTQALAAEILAVYTPILSPKQAPQLAPDSVVVTIDPVTT